MEVYYRAYIYDRYNWDVERDSGMTIGKTTFIPNEIEWLIDQDLLTDQNMPEFRRWQPDYVTAVPDDPSTDVDEGGYMVNDALLGTMMEFGEAQSFDIVGSGRIRSVFLNYASEKEGSDEPLPSESKGR